MGGSCGEAKKASRTDFHQREFLRRGYNLKHPACLGAVAGNPQPLPRGHGDDDLHGLREKWAAAALVLFLLGRIHTTSTLAPAVYRTVYRNWAPKARKDSRPAPNSAARIGGVTSPVLAVAVGG
jgi:hypothetical protein